MKIAKSKITFIFLAIIMVAAIMLATLLPCTIHSFAESSVPSVANASEYLTAKPQDAQGANSGLVKSDTLTLTLQEGSQEEGYAYDSYLWRGVSSFTINLNKDEYFKTLDLESFEYSYTLIWTPETINNDKKANLSTGHAAIEVFKSGQASSIDDIPTSIQLFLDKDLADENDGLYIGDIVDKKDEGQDENSIGKYEQFGAWGLYMFKFHVQGAPTEIATQLFEILPDDVAQLRDVEHKTLEITMDDTSYSSRHNLGKAHHFEVNEDFKYVNRALIVWSAEGTAKDGRKYVLTDKDLEKHAGEDYHSIYGSQAHVRQGSSYTFDPPMEGTWKVTCSIYNSVAAYDSGIQPYFEVTSDSFQTFKGMSLAAIIGIIIAVAVVALTVVVVVIVISIKKERVY